MQPPRRHRLLSALFCAGIAFAPVFASAHEEAAAPASGFSLPGAIRAVALRDPALVAPAGVAPAQLMSLPADSPVWTQAASALVEVGLDESMGLSMPHGGAASLVKDALAHPQVAAAFKDASLRHQERAAAVRGDAEDLSRRLLDGAEAVITQAFTQRSKISFRGLDHYEYILSPHSAGWAPASPSNEGLRAAFLQDRPLEALLRDAARGGRRPVWADVGGGSGFAGREWSFRGAFDVRRFLIDLLDWEKMPLTPEQDRQHRKNAPLLAPEHRPELILADAASVVFPVGARPDLITMIHSLQYCEDKLKVVAHLYNQLADHGVMVLADADFWTERLLLPAKNERSPRSLKTLFSRAPTVFDRLASALVESGVPVLTATERSFFRTPETAGLTEALVARKKPGTRMEVRARLDETTTAGSGYVVSRYRLDGRAPVAIIPAHGSRESDLKALSGE